MAPDFPNEDASRHNAKLLEQIPPKGSRFRSPVVNFNPDTVSPQAPHTTASRNPRVHRLRREAMASSRGYPGSLPDIFGDRTRPILRGIARGKIPALRRLSGCGRNTDASHARGHTHYRSCFNRQSVSCNRHNCLPESRMTSTCGDGVDGADIRGLYPSFLGFVSGPS